MAPPGEEVDGGAGGGLVVGGQGGEVGKAQLPGAVGQKQAGGAHALELRLEMAEVPAQEDDARGLSLPAEAAGVGHLVVLLVEKVDGCVPFRAAEGGLQALHQIGEEDVVLSPDDDGDTGPRLLFEAAGVAVGLEALLGHHGEDPLPGLLADIGVVVEHSGHRRYAAAGQLGNVFDRH